MDKMINPEKIKKLYDDGKNISSYLREELGLDYNSTEIIDVTYDIQAGSYTKYILENKDIEKYYENYSKEIVKTILDLCKPSSILEAGIGEATTFANVLDHFDYELDSFGFDISFSRIMYAREYLNMKKHFNTKLCTGNLFDIPFLDNSIDVVYTSHSIEPNGGNEEEILKELYRVTNKYLILLEPAYEFADEKSKKRMDSLGYCKGLKEKSLELGYEVIKHNIFPYYKNPQNPKAITIIKKSSYKSNYAKNKFACPKFKTKLNFYNDGEAFYSEESLMLYPIIKDIPCLRVENGIIATKIFDIKKGI